MLNKAEEILNKYFRKVEIGGNVFYDCLKCKEKGLSTKFATEKDALFHYVMFHGKGMIYQYFEDIRRIYGEKTLREITKNRWKR